MVAMGENTSSEQVNNVTDTALNGKGDRRGCFNCGQDDRFPRDRCPARGHKCDQCGEISHFKVVSERERPGLYSWGRKVEQKIRDSDKKMVMAISTCPKYVFSVRDETRQSSGIVTPQDG